MNTPHVRKITSQPQEPTGYYKTPPTSTQALLRLETFPRGVWEPACGDGKISRVLWAHGFTVFSSDLHERGYGVPGIDFLAERELRAPAIITNPPFPLADEFVIHACELGAERVAMFLPLSFLAGGRRWRRLWTRYPVRRVWVFCARQTLWRGDEEQREGASGAITFAWFVWERGYTGWPEHRWISAEEAPSTSIKRKRAS